MKKKILVVEDDNTFRKTLIRTLQIEGFETEEAYDGDHAKQMLASKDIDLVISDIRMPKLHGIELLHYINREYDIPVILMSGFSEIIGVKEALEIGATNFIPKPFSNDYFLEVVNSSLRSRSDQEQDEAQNNHLLYCKIDIENFENGSQFQVPIFLKINNSKFIKIAHLGENIGIEQIKRLILKGVEYLYLKNEDYIDLIAKINDLKNIIVSNPKISTDKKIGFTKHALNIISQYGYEKKFDEPIYQYARDTFEQIITLLCTRQNSYKALEYISQKSSLYAHCLNTSFVSIALCKSNKWNTHGTLLSIGSAAIFHDIGKIDLDEELLYKDPVTMDDEETQLYESHPQKGVEILNSFQIKNEIITQVVAQHHENCDGSGFPLGISKLKICPPARIIALANEFTKHLNGFGGVERIDSAEKIMSILKEQKQKFDKEQLNHLDKLAKFVL